MVVLVFNVNVIINIQTENYRGLISSKVVTCSSVKTYALQFLQEFQALSNSEKVRIGQQCKRKKVDGVRPCFAMSRKTDSKIDKRLDFISL